MEQGPTVRNLRPRSISPAVATSLITMSLTMRRVYPEPLMRSDAQTCPKWAVTDEAMISKSPVPAHHRPTRWLGRQRQTQQPSTGRPSERAGPTFNIQPSVLRASDAIGIDKGRNATLVNTCRCGLIGHPKWAPPDKLSRPTVNIGLGEYKAIRVVLPRGRARRPSLHPALCPTSSTNLTAGEGITFTTTTLTPDLTWADPSH